jgi:hypothetical protein
MGRRVEISGLVPGIQSLPNRLHRSSSLPIMKSWNAWIHNATLAVGIESVQYCCKLCLLFVRKLFVRLLKLIAGDDARGENFVPDIFATVRSRDNETQ